MSILRFTAHDHKYTSINDAEKQWLSVTSFVGQFKQPFNADVIAEKSSKKRNSKWYGMTPSDIKTAWKNEALRATTLGTWYHNCREKDICDLNDMERHGKTIPVVRPKEIEGVKYSPDQKLSEGIYPEHLVYLNSAGICGQSDLVEVVNDEVFITDYKGLSLDTIIPTKDGFKEIKDIKIGDVIYDGNGNLTKVENVSEIHYNPCYKITFDTNDTIICDHEHKWFIDERNVYGKKQIVSYKEKEVTTVELLELFNKRQRLRIKCVKINNSIKNLPIDPYIFGLWLGDGSKQCGAITNMSDDIWKEIEKRGYSVGEDISQGRAGKAQTKTIFNLYSELNKLNLIKNKHIPDIYLKGNTEQRFDLLRGLMDSDGYFHKQRKRCVMNTTQKWQADAVMELVSSLGYKPTLLKTHAFYNNQKIPAFQVVFKMSDKSPFLIRNKQYGANNFRVFKHKQSEHRIIKNIEIVETVPTKCLSVESKTHSYLATRNYIKTHNTNKEIKLEGFTNWEGKVQKMSRPISHLDDCHLNHYALQLSIYMYIILKHNPRLKVGGLTIHHILFEEAGRDKYDNPITALDSNGDPVVKDIVQYDLPYLKSEVISLIHWLEDNRDKIKTK